MTGLTQAVTHLTDQVEALIDSHTQLASRPATTLQPKLLTKADAAIMLGVSEQKVGLMISSGELQSIKLGRLVRIPVEVIDDYISSLLDKAA
jgi:excisionase family DNA binding protein